VKSLFDVLLPCHNTTDTKNGKPITDSVLFEIESQSVSEGGTNRTRMAVQIIPSGTVLFLLFLTLATILEQSSAFSTSSLICKRQQRIGRITSQHHGGTEGSRLFADASDTMVKAPEKQNDDEVATDPAKTTAQFLAGLWKLIAKGNDMVRGVSSFQISFTNHL
jgi:hypothetical protein